MEIFIKWKRILFNLELDHYRQKVIKIITKYLWNKKLKKKKKFGI
jgi:hypothetical protein